jgi:transcriptional regulator with XRE-family HTH domain
VSAAAADRSWRHDPRWRRRLTDYERNRYQQQRAGTWAPFTSTGPVREHLEHLYACGMTQGEISRVAGVSVTAMYRSVKASRMSTAAAQALLAVQPTQDRHAEMARHALRALVADGWTLQQLADATGPSVRTIGRTVNDRSTPLPATAAAISDVHQHLSLEDPGDGAAATHSRLRAARVGWEPNTPRPELDEIDSVAVDRVLHGGVVPLCSAEQQAALQRLAGKHPDHEIGRRLGVSSRTVLRHRASQGLRAYGSSSPGGHAEQVAP